MTESDQPRPYAGDVFATTHWSVVLKAKLSDAAASQMAMEQLCRAYWPPIYSYIRRDGYRPEDAQDLTQEFLSRFVHREWLDHLRDRRGRFRSFLLTFLKHFLSDQRDRDHAQKRGGDQRFVSLNAYEAEERSVLEPCDALTPELAYERRWVQALMVQAVERLRREYAGSGRASLFAALQDVQPGERGEISYAEIGVSLGLSEQAVKNAVHRLRRRHRKILQEEIARTVANDSEVEDEIQHLMTVLAR
jgi:RNA polymerase sigma-70 factor (ECF subfamily)